MKRWIHKILKAASKVTDKNHFARRISLIFPLLFILLIPSASYAYDGQPMWANDGISLMAQPNLIDYRYYNFSSFGITATGTTGAVVTWDEEIQQVPFCDPISESVGYQSLMGTFGQKLNSINGTKNWGTWGTLLSSGYTTQTEGSHDPINYYITVHPPIFGKMASDGNGGAFITNGKDIMRVDKDHNVVFTKLNIMKTYLDASTVFDIVEDDNGGAIAVWEDSDVIYVKKFDSLGNVVWTNSIGGAGAGWTDQVVADKDGSGGAVVGWCAGNTVHVGGVNAAGTSTWTNVVSASGSDVAIAGDGSGGAIVAWHQYALNVTSLYAAYSTGQNIFPWATPGNPMGKVKLDPKATSPISFGYGYHRQQGSLGMVSDGAGGAFIVFDKEFETKFTESSWWTGTIIKYATRVACQHVDRYGETWGDEGIFPTPYWDYADFYEDRQGSIAGDGAGGAMITWADNRLDGGNINSQKFDRQGNLKWGINGSPVCYFSETQDNPVIAHNGYGGATIAWLDQRNVNFGDNIQSHYRQVYAQGTEGSLHYVEVVDPNNGEEKLDIDEPYDLKWIIYGAEHNDVTVRLSTNEGSTWDYLITQETGVIGETSYSFTPTLESMLSKHCYISVEAGNPAAFDHDTNNVVFTIQQKSPHVHVLYPNGGERLRAGNTIEVQWTATDVSEIKPFGVTIKYSKNGGTGWETVATGLTNSGSYMWTLPDIFSKKCKVMVQVENTLEAIGYDKSDSNFLIGNRFVTNQRTGYIYFEIQEALSTTETIAGDTLLCDPGRYPENIVWGAKQDITLKGAGAGLTTLDAENLGRAIDDTNGMRFSIYDLTIMNGNTSDANGGGAMYIYRAYIGLTRVQFLNNTAAGPAGGGAISAIYTADITAKDCIFRGNISMVHGGVAQGGIWHLDSCIFDNNYTQGDAAVFWGPSGAFLQTIHTCDNTIFSGNYAEGVGGVANHSSFYSIRNCTFINNFAKGGGSIQANAGFEAKNSIITAFGSFEEGSAFVGGNLGTLKYCDLYGVSFESMTNGGGNITSEPLFIGAPYDLHLLSTSECIDAGTNEGTNPNHDLDGNPRPIHAYDMGAYETNSTPEVWVSYTNGSDTTGTGSIESPYQTIGFGLSKVSNRGTVYCFGDTYPEYNIIWPGTYNITLKASLETTPVTIDAGGISPRTIFIVTNTVNMTLEGLTLQKAKQSGSGSTYAGGALALNCSNTNVTFNNCLTQYCTADYTDGWSGGVYSLNDTNKIYANNSKFLNNKGYWGGVGQNGTWIVNNCYFNGNIGGNGVSNAGNWTVSNSTFEASIYGVAYLGTWNVSNSQFINTTTAGNLFNGTTLNVKGSLFNNNAGRFGVVALGGTMTATNCAFYNNNAGGNSGGVMVSVIGNFYNCIFSGNRAFNGAVFADYNVYGPSKYMATNCTFNNNIATNFGGVVMFGDPPSTFKAKNCIFWGTNDQFYIQSGNGTITAEYSDVQNMAEFAEARITSKEGMISDFPWFIATSEPYDFHMQLYSPCIDVGTKDGTVFDKDGTVRPQGDGYDMGVYEQAGLELPIIWVLNPNGGEKVYTNRIYPLSWKIGGHLNSDIYVRLSTNEGQSWDYLITQETGVLGVTTLEWIATSNLSSYKCLISIEAGGPDGWNYDTSNATFEIRDPDTWISFTTGSNTVGAGTVDNPYQTIGFGLTKVASNAAVMCFGDTYYEYNIVWPNDRVNLTIKSSLETSPATIDAGAVSPRCIFIVNNPVNITLESLTLQKVYAHTTYNGAAMSLYCSNTSVNLKNCITRFCTGDAGAECSGVIYSQNDTNRIYATNSKFLNSKGGYGGVGTHGIWTVNNCYFSGNLGTCGVSYGGIWTVTNSTFESNPGGVSSSSTWNANNCLFQNNTGGVGVASTWYVTNSKFKGNSYSGNGGVFAYSTGAATNCAFYNNTAAQPGAYGGVTYGGPWRMTNCIFAGNFGWYGGVATRYSIGTFEAVNCTFVNNWSYQGGVGKDFVAQYPFNATNCIFWGNTKSGFDTNTFNNSSGGKLRYSDLQITAEFTSFVTKECKTVNPLFVSTAEGTFQLLASSECINSGTFEGAPATDITGVSRPQPATSSYANFDMGVYEQEGPFVRVATPNGGEVITAESASYPITYNVSPDASNIYVRVSTDSGNTWTQISHEAWFHTGVCTLNWKPTASFISNECLISVEAYYNSKWMTDVSDATFEVRAKSLLPIVYVSTIGSDEAGNGSYDLPYATVQKGLDRVSSEGQVLMLPGTYEGAGNFNITWPNKDRITLKLSPEATQPATIDAQTTGQLISLEAPVALSIESITLQNGSATHGSAIYLQEGSNLNLDNIKITGCSGNVIWNTNSTTRIINGIIRDNNALVISGGTMDAYQSRFLGNGQFSSSAGAVGDGCIVHAVNCIFADNHRTDAATVFGSSTIMAENCSFVGNSGNSGNTFTGSAITARNSIFWNNSENGGGFNASSANISYSDIDTWDFVAGAGNISVEPLFVSSTYSDPDFLKPLASSETVDSGTFEGAPATDIDGTLRPQPAATLKYDMGVYEQTRITLLPIVYVSTSGNDSNDGATPSTAKATIQNALNTVAAGGLVSVETGTYQENLVWPERNNITLKSWDTVSPPVIDGFNPDTLFSDTVIKVNMPANLTIEGFSIINGNDGGADIGGGMHVEAGSRVWLIRDRFENNIGENGAAIKAVDATVEIHAVDCVFNSNTCSGPFAGGCAYLGSWEANNCTFTNNGMGFSGGVAFGGTWKADSCDFENNAAANGGAFYNTVVTVSNSIFKNNSSPGVFGMGGVAFSDVNSPWIASNCTFEGNNSAHYGGVFYGDGSNTIILLNSMFRDNLSNNGGVAYNSIVLATNCAFSANNSTGYGGVAATSEWSDVNCTYVSNEATLSGGVAFGCTSWISKNSIFWDNISIGTPTYPVFDQSMTPIVTYSDQQPGSDLVAGAGNISIDPLFMSLTYGNANFLKPDLASLTVNTGTFEGAPTMDAFGVSRPQPNDGVSYDMGVYEQAGPSYAFSITPASGELYASASSITVETTYYHITINNEGNFADSYTFAPVYSPSGWLSKFYPEWENRGVPSTDALSHTNIIAAGASVEVFIGVTPPIGAALGSVNTTEVSIVSDNDGTKSAVATFETMVGNWMLFRQQNNNTRRSVYNGAQHGFLKWSYPTGGAILSSAVIGNDGTIYVNSNDNYLYAINPDGSFKWRHESGTTGMDVSAFPAIDNNGTIYIGGLNGNMYAINPDGSTKWTTLVDGSGIFSSPAIGSDGTIYFGTINGYLYAMDQNGTAKWSYSTGSSINYSSPAIGSDGTIYVGANDGKLYAINQNNTLLWSFPTGDRIESSPAIGTDGTIYVGSYDHKIYAINPDGTSKWEILTSGSVFSSPAIASDGTIFVGAANGTLNAINPDGSLKWTFNTGDPSSIFSSPAVDNNGVVYVGVENSYVYAINQDGSTRWSYLTGGYLDMPPAIGSDGTIYIGSSDNKLYAVGTDLLPVVYISPSGSDEAGDGSYNLPYETLQKGLDVVAISGEVRMLPGVYMIATSEFVNDSMANWPNKTGITLKLSPEATQPATLDAMQNGRLIFVGYPIQITIEGVDIVNGMLHLFTDRGGGIYLTSGLDLSLTNVQMINNIVDFPDNGAGGALRAEGSRIRAKNSVFRNNGAGGWGGMTLGGDWDAENCTFSYNNAHDCGVAVNSQWKVKNCIFLNNGAYTGGVSGGVPNIWNAEDSYFIGNSGFNFQDGVSSGGTWTATNCVFANNTSGPNFGLAKSGNWTTYNCTFLNNNIVASDCTWRSFNSIYWNDGATPSPIFYLTTPILEYCDMLPSDFWAGTGNISIEPKLIATPGDPNFGRLAPNSKCVNLLTMNPDIPALDAVGAPRPHNYLADMGAYEYQGPDIKVIYPNGGEVFTSGQIIEVLWTATDESGLAGANPITINYSTDNGATWAFAGNTQNTGLFTWEAPIENSKQYLISIEAVNNIPGVSGYDISDATFEVMHARVWNSTQGKPYNTISAALGDPILLSGDLITVEAGIFSEYDILWPSINNITLRGEGSGLTTIDAQSSGRIFQVNDPLNISIEGITMKNANYGSEGAVIYLQSGSILKMTDCGVRESVLGSGILIYCRDSTVEVVNSLFTKNNTTIFGWGSILATGSVFKDNSAGAGSVQFGGGASSGIYSMFTNCTFEGNAVSGSGGIVADNNEGFNAYNCEFKRNSAANGGGVFRYTTGVVTNCVFADNYAGTQGGVMNDGGPITANNCVFIRNTCEAIGGGNNGGGVIDYGMGIFNNCIFYDNYSSAGNVQGPYSNMLTFNYSNVQNNGMAWYMATFNNCSSAEPRFISTTEGDAGYLVLDMGSPAIDTASIEAPTPDLADNVRPHGLGNDMGVFEYQGPSVRIIQPNGGNELYANVPINIVWETSAETTTNIKVWLSTNEGVTWDTLISEETWSHAEGTRSISWTPLTEYISTECRIKVEISGETSGLTNYDISDSNFTISEQPNIVYIAPYPTGSDEAGNGSYTLPYATLQKGLDVVAISGEVRAMPGVFTIEASAYAKTLDSSTYQTMALWPNKTDITLISTFDALGNSAPVTFDAESNGRFISLMIGNGLRMSIKDVTVTNGHAITDAYLGALGGAFLLYPPNVTLSIKDVICVNNNADNVGGVVASVFSGNNIFAENSQFIENAAFNSGGVALQGTWTVTNCAFVGNGATNGSGGVGYNSGIWRAYNCLFKDNFASTRGGVFNSVIVSVTGCTFEGNWAPSGAIFTDNGEFNVLNCIFKNNRATTGSGSIAYQAGTLTATNCVFANNSAAQNGFSNYANNVNLNNCTVYGNTAETYGISNYGTYNLLNTIIWGNSATTSNNSFGPSATVNSSYSDIQPDGWVSGTGNISIEPLFVNAPSGNLHLANGSPAIDKGNDIANYVDYELNVRPHGLGYDMGAYEFQGPSVRVTYPNGGELLKTGDNIQISLEVAPSVSEIYIRLSSNEGASWDTEIAHLTGGYGGIVNQPWTVTDINSTDCLVSVEVSDGLFWNIDSSNAKFSIVGNISVVYVSPEGSDITGSGTYANPYRTVQKGLNRVDANGEVRMMQGIYSEGGIYSQTGDYNIQWPALNDIMLKLAPEASGPATIDALYLGRVINVPNPTNLSIEGITIQNGKLSDAQGAGIWLQAGSNMSLENVKMLTCSVEGNSNGGAVYSNSANVIVNNCKFIGNFSGNVASVAGQGNWTVSGSKFIDNHSTAVGGVAYSVNMNVSSSEFIGNSGSQGGILLTGVINASGCIFNGNYSTNTNNGGGIVSSATLYAINSTFEGNSAAAYGAISHVATVVATNCAFTGNYSVKDGGLFATNSNVTLDKCNVVNNHANRGGVFYNMSSVSALNTLFVNNSATNEGGIFYNCSSISYLRNCVLFGNGASGGGIEYNSGVNISNSIVWNNTASNGYNVDMGGSFTKNFTDIQFNNGSVGSGNISVEPMFVSTYESDPNFMKLGPNSPCIDVASTIDSLPIDKAGNARPYGFGYDMGAYEFQGPSIILADPVGEENINQGEHYPVTWVISGDVVGDVTVRFSSDGGSTWSSVITSQLAQTGVTTFDWVAPSVVSNICRVSVEVMGTTLPNYDVSNDFRIDALSLVVYISPTLGNDTSGDGSIGSPYRTLNKGLNQVLKGGEVRALGGKYTLTSGEFINGRMAVWPKTQDISLKLAAEATQPATFDAQSLGGIIRVAGPVNITIEGVEFRNARLTTDSRGGVIQHPGDAKIYIKDSLFDSNTIVASNTNGGAIKTGWNTNFTIINSIFSNNSGAYGGAINGMSGTWNISNSTFMNNTGTYGGAVYGGYSNITATNSIFIGNHANQHGGVTHYGYWNVNNCSFLYNSATMNGGIASYAQWTSRNSILFNNSAPTGDLFQNMNLTPAAPPTAQYCDVQPSQFIAGTGNISLEPVIASTIETDPNFIQLGAGSPCIDVADPITSLALDKAGNSRPHGLGPDMGVYEFQGPSIRVIQPNGGENILAGSIYPLTFEVTPQSTYIYVRLSTDEGTTWISVMDLGGTVSGIYHYPWPVPNLSSSECLISIEARDNGVWNIDTSDATFEIIGVSTRPTTLEIEKHHPKVKIKWSGTDNVDVWVLIPGTGNYYDYNGSWTKVASNVGPNEWIDPVGDMSDQKYYRIAAVGSALFSLDGSGSIESVGKFTLELTDTKLNLISIPLVQKGEDILSVIGTEDCIGSTSGDPYESDMIYKYISTGQDGYYSTAFLIKGSSADERNNKWWDVEELNNEHYVQSAIKVRPTEGYWIRLVPGSGTRKVTIVGKVATGEIDINVNTDRLRLVGSPYPAQVTLFNSDLWKYAKGTSSGAPEESDKIYKFNGDPVLGNYNSALLMKDSGDPAYDDKWFDVEKLNFNEIEETTIQLKPGEGYWLETVNGDYEWKYPKSY